MNKRRIFLAAAIMLSSGLAQAQDGTWSTTSAAWNVGSSWSGGIIADGSGNTADFSSLDPASDITVTLGADRTIGNLIFGDTNTTTAAGWTVAGANILTLAGTTPTITVNPLGTGKVATISSVITGAAGLTKNGLGTLTIGANATYTGTTTVSSGILNYTANQTNVTTYAGPGIVHLSSGVTSFNNTIAYGSGFTGTLDISTGGTVQMQGGNVGTAFSTNLGDLNLGAGTSITVNGSTLRFDALTGSGTMQNTAFSSAAVTTLTLGVNNGSGNFTGAITSASVANGSIVVNKLGTGTQTFGGANTYSGTTTVSGGTLAGTQTTGTPFGTRGLNIGAAIVSLTPSGTGANVSVAGGTNIQQIAAFTYNAGATFSLNKGSQSSLTYTYGGPASTVVRGTNGTLILSVSAIGNLGNTVAGGGERFVFTGSNVPIPVNNLVTGVVAQDRSNGNAGDFVTYGATNGFAAATPDLVDTFAGSANTSYVSVTTGTSTTGATAAYALKVSGATVTNTGNTLSLGSTGAMVSGLILNNGSISGGILTTPTGVATEFTVYTSGTSAITSNINTATSQAGMSVFGPGSLDLSGSTGNSFTGGLRINNSTVIASSDNQLGGTSSTITLTGGTLQTSGTFALGTTGQRGITLALGQDQAGGTLNVTSGTTTFTSASGKVISGTSLTKAGAGTLVLAGSVVNTYTGTTTISAGTLSANNIVVSGGGSQLGNATSAVILGDAANQGTLSYTGGAATFTRGFTINAGGGQLTNAGSALLTVDTGGIAASGLFTVGGATQNITINSSISGSGGLTKTGNNLVTLGSANTYGGNTTLSAGQLTIQGTIANNGPAAVFIAAPDDSFSSGPANPVLSRRVAATTSYTLGSLTGQGATAVSTDPVTLSSLNTTASILAGTASVDTDVTMAWRTRTTAEAAGSNPNAVLSDVINLNGTGNDVFLMQMSYRDEALAALGLDENSIASSGELRLGWLNGSTWTAAVAGNTSGAATFEGIVSGATFLAGLGVNPLSSKLGSYGVDPATNTVWAVLNHNSEFAVIPEPSTWAMLVCGGVIMLGLRRKLAIN